MALCLVYLSGNSKGASNTTTELIGELKNELEEQTKSALLYLMSFYLASMSGNEGWTNKSATETLKE